MPLGSKVVDAADKRWGSQTWLLTAVIRSFKTIKTDLYGKRFSLKYHNDKCTKKAEEAALGHPVEDKIDPVHAKRELIRKLHFYFDKIIQQRSDDEYSMYLNAYPSKDGKNTS